MIRLPPRSTRTDTLFPYTTLFRSCRGMLLTALAVLAGCATPPHRADDAGHYRVIGYDTVRGNIRPADVARIDTLIRSEEHTSELQSLMRISYAVFCLKKKKNDNIQTHQNTLQHTVYHIRKYS